MNMNGLKLSISNIAWDASEDEEMYAFLNTQGIAGLEIAPTRVFGECPYKKLLEASKYRSYLKKNYNLKVSSIQSMWYGKTENIFSGKSERKRLLDYTKQCIDFAKIVECKNIVFGCPKNRNMLEGTSCDDVIEFFMEVGEYASSNNTYIALEPNPTMYGTNFINTTSQAIDFVRRVHSNGLRVNVDIGTILANKEDIDVIIDNIKLVNHIHVSEPGLKIIERRKLHDELAQKLRRVSYHNFISVEMGKRNNLEEIKEVVFYIKNVFLRKE